jgi:hypothetical protein
MSFMDTVTRLHAELIASDKKEYDSKRNECKHQDNQQVNHTNEILIAVSFHLNKKLDNCTISVRIFVTVIRNHHGSLKSQVDM